MSLNEHDRVLEALDVLCNVSKETLRSLRTQVPLAFQKLQALVANSSHPQDTNRFSPSLETQSLPIPCSHSQTSTSDVSNITDTSSATLGTQDSISSIHLSSSPSSADGHSLPNSISSLIEALNKSSVQIKDFLSRSEFEDTRDELERMIEDPRVVDLQLDKRRQSDKVRFRKGLSQRSLAIEYSQWENCTYKSSRVSELVEDLATAQEKAAGHIKEYINLNGHRFINTQVTRTGIEHGIKMLVLERLLGKRAISAILSFKYRRFRVVKYEDLDSLVRGMKQTGWIMELAEKKADWLDGCQNQYDGMYSVLELAPLNFVQHGAVTYCEGRARVSLRQKPAENAAGLTKRRLNIKVFHNLEIIFQRRHGKGATVVAKVNNLRQRFTKVYVVGLRNGSANL